MNWKFWKKTAAAPPAGAGKTQPKPAKPGKPRDLPQEVGRFLVVNAGQDPDRVWNLKCVLRAQEGTQNRYDFRVFDPGLLQRDKITVSSFATLDEHPDVIVYEGWYDKGSTRVTLAAKN